MATLAPTWIRYAAAPIQMAPLVPAASQLAGPVSQQQCPPFGLNTPMSPDSRALHSVWGHGEITPGDRAIVAHHNSTGHRAITVAVGLWVAPESDREGVQLNFLTPPFVQARGGLSQGGVQLTLLHGTVHLPDFYLAAQKTGG